MNVHFVGFRGDEYWRACRVFGAPDFIHIRHDLRMRREVADGDTVVFGPAASPERIERNGPDIVEVKR